MSKYEDYTRVAEIYDATRFPQGADLSAAVIISSQLSGGRCRELTDIAILDAGCGTGNYSARFIAKHGLTNLTLLDASEAMLERARAKLHRHPAAAKVQYRSAVMPELPFPDSAFNAVMFNFVLHHLEDDLPMGTQNSYGKTKEALSAAARCLKGNGMLAITTVTHEQLPKCAWFLSPEWIPERVFNTLEMKLIPVPMIVNHLEHLGFVDIKVLHTVNDHFFSDEALKNYDGPLEESFRKSASLFTCMNDVEVKEMIAKINKMKANGTYMDYVKRREGLCDIYGTATLVYARKVAA